MRPVLDTRDQYKTLNQAIHSIAVSWMSSLRKWVRQAEFDADARPGTTTEESAKVKALEKQVAGLLSL